MRFTVKDTSAGFLANMEQRAKNITFAAAVALTRTAYKVKDAQVELMRRRLDKPTPFALNSLYVKAAKKDRLYAEVETKLGFGSVPAGRFLEPLIEGGQRRMKSHEKQLGSYTGPSRFAPKDAYGNVPGSFYKRVLSQLKASSDPMQNATNSPRSTRKRKAESFYIVGNVILSRKAGQEPKPMLFLVRKVPTYRKMLPWYETADEVISQTLPEEYFKALAQYSK